MGGLAGGIIIEGTKNTKMAFYYFGLYSFGCGGVALIIFIVGKLFCKRPAAQEADEDVGDVDEDDEAAAALQPNDDEKNEDEKNNEEEIEKEMVVAVKINTINAT